jgi:hypothetical protein
MSQSVTFWSIGFKRLSEMESVMEGCLAIARPSSKVKGDRDDRA